MNNRLQILYQKTDFNHHKICQLEGIFKCSKCKKNNTILAEAENKVQLCLFCGMPNLLKHIIESKSK
jgi:ribosomal protein S27E